MMAARAAKPPEQEPTPASQRVGAILWPSFFVAGVALPAISLFAARSLRWLVVVTTVWMLVSLVGFVWFGMMSSGGV